MVVASEVCASPTSLPTPALRSGICLSGPKLFQLSDFSCTVMLSSKNGMAGVLCFFLHTFRRGEAGHEDSLVSTPTPHASSLSRDDDLLCSELGTSVELDSEVFFSADVACKAVNTPVPFSVSTLQHGQSSFLWKHANTHCCLLCKPGTSRLTCPPGSSPFSSC